MRSSGWKAIIGFVLHWHSSTEAVSKCQTIHVIQAKLDEISRKKNKIWEVFVEEDLTKASTELPAVDVSGDIDKDQPRC